MMGTLNYSTTIAASKTVGEMQAMLAQHGAGSVSVDYDDGRAVGLSFALTTLHGPRHFTIPVDVPAMQRLLIRQDKAGQLRSGRKDQRTSMEQAERVAWRVMKDWLAAQLALVESQMASLDQVMLSYVQVQPGITLYQAYSDREQRAIEAIGGQS